MIVAPFSRFYNLTTEKKNKILESSISEFTQQCFDGFSLDQIISNSGFSKGLFYY